MTVPTPPGWTPPPTLTPPPNWHQRLLPTTKAKGLAALAVVVAVVVVVAIVVTGFVILRDDNEKVDLGNGVSVGIDAPSGWKTMTFHEDDETLALLVPESESRSAEKVAPLLSNAAKGSADADDLPVSGVAMGYSSCDNAAGQFDGADGLKSVGISVERVGDWLETENYTVKHQGWTSTTRSAAYLPADCKGNTVMVTAIDATDSSATPPKKATELLRHITRGEVVTPAAS
ncbi:hypothetical protein [Gordonia sp. MP11Mi]|uniref:Uncharacterized protein n=1 Tax=Gordonia sp. MP11Mi TaxID=3022769 RepID=A0AA97GUQ4_9ACTN